MIRSNLRRVKAEREEALGHKITYSMITSEAGVSANVVCRLMKFGVNVRRIDGKTLEGLCAYFNCTVGDLLEYIRDEVQH